MKILICILGFSKSGGSRVLSQFANYWIREGHEVTFLSNINYITPHYPTNAQIIWYDNDGSLVELAHNTIKNHTNVLIEQYALYNSLKKISNKFNIILATHSLTALPVSLSGGNAKKFYYIQAYEPDYYAYRQGIVNKFLQFYLSYTYRLKNLHKIVNAPVYYEFKKLKANTYVPCGLDLELYFPKHEINLNKSIIKIGAIGRIEAFKGTKYVIEALTKLNLNNIPKSFILYLAFGDKNIESEMIQCPQLKNDTELAEFYRSMDIIIAPGTTQYGAIHYPVIEAMACGTPIITTFYLPAHENNAWLAKPHSVDSIINQVFEIINNQDLACAKAWRAVSDIQQFEWSLVAKKMLCCFADSNIKAV